MYLSEIKKNSYGLCLIATKDLPSGAVVQHWEGSVVERYEDVPEKMKLHAILVDDKWFVPSNNAQYANHSCEPNCIVDDNLDVVTIKPVKKGEELTFDYCVTYKGEDPGQWHDEWTFVCKCGSKKCRGKIDKYVTEEGKPFVK